MYSTCLFCTRDLGTNDVIETLPVGRLWVVCRHCARWNLVPFETRFESIDAGDRLFRDTRVRFSTDNIGIARLKEGLELVRIGPALRPEFAAWRYGDSFGRRRKRALVAGGAVAVAGIGLGAGAALGASALGIGGLFVTQMAPHLWKTFMYATRGRQVIVRVPRDGEAPLVLTRSIAAHAQFEWLSSGGWGVRTHLWAPGRFIPPTTPGKDQGALITGPDAERVLSGILAHTNEFAGKRTDVASAVEMLEARGSASAVLSSVNAPSKYTRIQTVKSLPRTWRLAAEMALHEESERAALAGELALLEWQWKEAERLAKISDSLALPDDIDTELDRLKS